MIFLCENMLYEVQTPPGAGKRGEKPGHSWLLAVLTKQPRTVLLLWSVPAGRLCVPGMRDAGWVLAGPSSLGSQPHTPKEGTADRASPCEHRELTMGQGHVRPLSSLRLFDAETQTQEPPCSQDRLLFRGIQQYRPFMLLRGGLLTSTCPNLLLGNVPLPGSASATSQVCVLPEP